VFRFIGPVWLYTVIKPIQIHFPVNLLSFLLISDMWKPSITDFTGRRSIQIIENRGYVNDGAQQLHEMTLDPLA